MLSPTKRIAILHYQLGYNDGVSLEAEKWKSVFEAQGHRVFRVAGDLGASEGILVEGLSYHDKAVQLLDRMAFSQIKPNEEENFVNRISALSADLESRLEKAFSDLGIDLLIVNNIWSVALNLPAAIALERVCKKLALPVIAHHHDFYWERKNGGSPTCATVEAIAGEYFPPNGQNLTHIVINSFAQNQMKSRKKTEAIIAPNVMDFDTPYAKIDMYNCDLRQKAGIKPNDIFVLQATRIITRKAIELAIDLVKRLNHLDMLQKLHEKNLYDGRRFDKENKVVLVLAGQDTDDNTGVYLKHLKEKAEAEGVPLHIISHMVGPKRLQDGKQKIYTLEDCYAVADLVTYPSQWEGWGNQLLEAVLAKLPVACFEYPVFLSDIKTEGIEVISLGSSTINPGMHGFFQIAHATMEKAAHLCLQVLTDREFRERMTENNFRIGHSKFSYQTLHELLLKIIDCE